MSFDPQRQRQVTCLDGPLVGRTYEVPIGKTSWILRDSGKTYFYRLDPGDSRFAVSSHASSGTEQERLTERLRNLGMSNVEVALWWSEPQAALGELPPRVAWDLGQHDAVIRGLTYVTHPAPTSPS